MTRFILLHQRSRTGDFSPLWINTAYIVTIVPETEDQLARVYSREFNCLVRETANEILSAILRAEVDI